MVWRTRWGSNPQGVLPRRIKSPVSQPIAQRVRGLDERIRTSTLLLPKQAPYRIRPHPDDPLPGSFQGVLPLAPVEGLEPPRLAAPG